MKFALSFWMLFAPIAAFAQVGPSAISTNAWLWCRTPAAANAVITQIDSAFGYPNYATATITTVPMILHPTTNWVLLPITLDVYSQAAKKYVTVSSVIPTNKLGIIGTNVPPSAITTNRMITEAGAIANGWWPTNQ